jgi:hypothetical protein
VNADLESLDDEERRRLSDELLILAQWTNRARAPERELLAVQKKARAILIGLLPIEDRPPGPPGEIVEVAAEPREFDKETAGRLRGQLLGLTERLAQLADPQRALYEVRHQARSVLEALVSHDDLSLAPGEPTFYLASVEELVVSFQWERDGDQVRELILSTELRSGALMRFRDAIVAMRKKFRLRRCRIPGSDHQICGNFFVPSRRQIYCRMHTSVMREIRRRKRRKAERRLREGTSKAKRR